mmetsp:Transcript_14784/g.48348  ORF Transcript_14784/g.48348 Transcript_14784/m.48348 type:complete len:211 (-) Transcript_14784:242-874(-)
MPVALLQSLTLTFEHRAQRQRRRGLPRGSKRAHHAARLDAARDLGLSSGRRHHRQHERSLVAPATHAPPAGQRARDDALRAPTHRHHLALRLFSATSTVGGQLSHPHRCVTLRLVAEPEPAVRPVAPGVAPTGARARNHALRATRDQPPAAAVAWSIAWSTVGRLVGEWAWHGHRRRRAEPATTHPEMPFFSHGCHVLGTTRDVHDPPLD